MLNEDVDRGTVQRGKDRLRGGRIVKIGDDVLGARLTRTGDREDLRTKATEKLQALERKENELLQKEIEEKEKKYFGGENDSIQNINGE